MKIMSTSYPFETQETFSDPIQRAVVEETLDHRSRDAQRIDQSAAVLSGQADFLVENVRNIDAAHLCMLLAGDIKMGAGGHQSYASGTASYIERMLGFYPRLPLSKIQNIDPNSPDALSEILSVSEGVQDSVQAMLLRRVQARLAEKKD